MLNFPVFARPGNDDVSAWRRGMVFRSVSSLDEIIQCTYHDASQCLFCVGNSKRCFSKLDVSPWECTGTTSSVKGFYVCDGFACLLLHCVVRSHFVSHVGNMFGSMCDIRQAHRTAKSNVKIVTEIYVALSIYHILGCVSFVSHCTHLHRLICIHSHTYVSEHMSVYICRWISLNQTVPRLQNTSTKSSDPHLGTWVLKDVRLDVVVICCDEK